MSAIYQRARPIRWDQVVGQEHVKDVLKAALEAGRVGHAYLFSGPRGVGKTTTARLIAMTANCSGPAPKPCGECESCLSVRAGSHPDVMEIDAASNNGVDDVRDLRELVGLAAMRGGKKIYILDEAHMMTKSAFNALLKTLEEPPGDVRFVLASEAAHQLLPTIRSRCLGHTMVWPAEAEMLAWLKGQGIAADAAPAFLRAAGGRPDDALALARSGRSPQAWALLPQAVARGDATALGDWSPAQVIDALQKLCHDLLAASVGAAPRYFAPADLPKPPPLGPLTRWSKALAKAARTADHPFNAGLMLEALVAQARNTLHSRH